MKHPFWVVNSALLLLALVVFLLTYFTRVSVPERERIRTTKRAAPSSQARVVPNVEILYQNDLFGLYAPTTHIQTSEDLLPELALPAPPRELPLDIPQTPSAQFLEPLDVGLKGIVVMRQDTTRNTAIIEDGKTKQEGMYRVGDALDDAQLIGVFSNKIVLLRSNGQQEVLYLREHDAKHDPAYIAVDGWENAIKLLGPNSFGVDLPEFKRRVGSLAQFIDMLSLTSVYRQGNSIGCRIGAITENSFGGRLGLKSGDTITAIDDIPTDTTQNRLQAYEHITTLQEGSTINAQLSRAGKSFDIQITLQDFGNKTAARREKQKADNAMPIVAAPQQSSPLSEQKQLTSTANKMRDREREHMLNLAAAS